MTISYELFFTDYTWLSTNQSLYLGFLLQAVTDERGFIMLQGMCVGADCRLEG